MSTTIPLTNEEISRQNTFCCCSLDCAAICASLYGIISALLLPFTIRGRIGGQYGVLIPENKKEGSPELSLTDISFEVEMFLIGLVFFAHFIGFISVLKKWTVGSVFYRLIRSGEIFICCVWLMRVINEDIRSHVMSQYSLGCYCFFALITGVISFFAVTLSIHEAEKKKKFDEELPSTMLV